MKPVMPSETPEANITQEPAAPETSLFPPEQGGPRRLWSLRDLFLFIAFAAAALLASNFLVLAGYTLLQAVVGWRTPSQALRDNPFFLLTLQSVFHSFLLGYVYFLVVVNYRQPFWTTLKWRNPSLHETLRFFLGGVLLALAVRLAPTVVPEKESFPLQRLFSSPEAAYAVAVFAVVVAPFMEELIFRGVLFMFFQRRAGLGFAVVSSAVLFAGLHVPEYWGAWNHIILILVVGLVFSLARGLTGSITPSVILHLAYNASLMAGLFFETQQFRSFAEILAR